MRLRGQYTFVIGGLVFSSLLVLGLALLAEQRRYSHDIGAVAAVNLAYSLERQIEKHGVAIASTLADRLVTPLYHGDYRLVVHETSEHRGYPDVLSAQVVDAAGVVIRGGEALEEEEDHRIDLPWVREALATGVPSISRDGRLLRIAAPAVASGHVLGAVVLDLSMEEIRRDIQEDQARLGNLIHSQSTALSLTGVALGIVLVTLSILAAVVVAGRLSRPVVA
ncbi:MAG: hypothetical protein ABR538_07510, partial [Candidatus Binatia bacterium]